MICAICGMPATQQLIIRVRYGWEIIHPFTLNVCESHTHEPIRMAYEVAPINEEAYQAPLQHWRESSS